jgi:hypothetical protein
MSSTAIRSSSRRGRRGAPWKGKMGSSPRRSLTVGCGRRSDAGLPLPRRGSVGSRPSRREACSVLHSSSSLAVRRSSAVAAFVGSSGAQQPGPPTGTLELVSLDRETRFAFVDNPPRRRERAGAVHDQCPAARRLQPGPLAGSTRRSPRRSRHPVWSRRDPRPSSSAMVRLWSAARSSIGGGATGPTRSRWWAAPAPTLQRAERW